jgi:hypothetical protein
MCRTGQETYCLGAQYTGNQVDGEFHLV